MSVFGWPNGFGALHATTSCHSKARVLYWKFWHQQYNWPWPRSTELAHKDSANIFIDANQKNLLIISVRLCCCRLYQISQWVFLEFIQSFPLTLLIAPSIAHNVLETFYSLTLFFYYILVDTQFSFIDQASKSLQHKSFVLFAIIATIATI